MNDLTKAQGTSAAKPRALPNAVDVLFARLAAQYGKHWLDLWQGMPIDAVKAEWAARLSGTKDYQIEAALNHVGKFPPTLPEFKSLCEQFRKIGQPLLVLADNRRDPMPGKVKEQIAKMMRDDWANFTGKL